MTGVGGGGIGGRAELDLKSSNSARILFAFRNIVGLQWITHGLFFPSPVPILIERGG